MSQFDDLNADDLQSVAEQLRANRHQASALELDAIKQRVRARAAVPASRRARSATFMKSRLAILAMLVAGLMLSTTGAGLAISGATGNDASVAQYRSNDDRGDVLGEDNSNSPGDVAGEDASGGAQPTQQVESGAGGELPFTGFLAIPVLLGGVALLGTGLVMRKRAADDR